MGPVGWTASTASCTTLIHQPGNVIGSRAPSAGKFGCHTRADCWTQENFERVSARRGIRSERPHRKRPRPGTTCLSPRQASDFIVVALRFLHGLLGFLVEVQLNRPIKHKRKIRGIRNCVREQVKEMTDFEESID